LLTTERRELHRWAAAYYGQPFIALAWQFAQRSGQSWSDEEVKRLARDYDGVVGHLVHQTQDMDQAHDALARALAWQRHLFAAAAYAEAGEIVIAIHDILARFGERDQAKSLLRRYIASLEEDDSLAIASKASAQGNLANLLLDEGKVDEALTTYQTIYTTLAAINAKQQMAGVLSAMATIYRNQDKLDKAIDHEERAMLLDKERGDEEGQVISLHQLSTLYRQKADYATALAYSQGAEALARKLNSEIHIAATMFEQGMIYKGMAVTATDLATGQAQRAIAAAYFQATLDLERRIGDEAGAAGTLSELGKLLLGVGNLAQAITAFSEALEIFQRQGNPTKVASAIECLGLVHEDQGEYVAALAKFQEVLALKQQYSSPQNIARTEHNIARVQAKLRGPA